MHPFVWLWHHCSPAEYQVLIDLEQLNEVPCPFMAAVIAGDNRHVLTRAAVAYRESAAWLTVPIGDHVGERWRDGVRTLITRPAKTLLSKRVDVSDTITRI